MEQLSKLSVGKVADSKVKPALMTPAIPDSLARWEDRARSIRKDRKGKILSAKRARYRNEAHPLADVFPSEKPDGPPDGKDDQHHELDSKPDEMPPGQQPDRQRDISDS